MVGVAATDIPAGAEGELAACGVFLLAKEAAASGKDVAQGAAVYLDADGKLITAGSDAANSLRVGVCWEPAASTAAVVSVKINV